MLNAMQAVASRMFCEVSFSLVFSVGSHYGHSNMYTHSLNTQTLAYHHVNKLCTQLYPVHDLVISSIMCTPGDVTQTLAASTCCFTL